MLPIKPSNTRVSPATLNFLVRFLWSSNKLSRKSTPDQQPGKVALADALNLLVKSTEEVKQPTFYGSLTKGPVEEQFNIANVNIPEPQPHVSDQLIANILQGIKSSNINYLQPKLNYSQLYEMSSRDLSSFIAEINSENTLFEMLQTFYNHNKLTIRIVSDIILNKNFKHMDKAPVDFSKIKKSGQLNDLDITKLEILLLKKYHDLKQPLNIIRVLKLNFDSKYLPLIKSGELTPFYERIVWRFVFEYLKQYKELHYIELLNSIKSSFLIWETSVKNCNLVAKDILEFHEKDLNGLQAHFLRIASAENLTHMQLKKLKRMSIKYKISQFDPSDWTLYEGLSNILDSEFGSVIQPKETFHVDAESMAKLFV